MWWLFSLASALVQVGRNAVMKDLGHSLDEYINVWGRFFFLLPFALAASLLAHFPSVGAEYWFYSFLAGFTQVISTLLLSKSFKYGAISISVALWKLQVVLVAILGAIFLNETITFAGTIGILVSLFGVYLLNVQRARLSLAKPVLLLFRERGMRYALLAALTLTPTILLFKKTAQLGDPYFSTLTNYIFASLLVLPLVIRKSARHLPVLPRYLGRFFAMGLFGATATIFGSLAYVRSVAAYVEAVKQVEIPITLAVGTLFFNEREKVQAIWPGCIILIAGLLILIFGS
ncbi:MAG TPA: EamA family transporter [Thermodesulfobacteriota bacterium]|nr:EamA family transporter [Thermodesulfobacteriota bacterium]